MVVVTLKETLVSAEGLAALGLFGMAGGAEIATGSALMLIEGAGAAFSVVAGRCPTVPGETIGEETVLGLSVVGKARSEEAVPEGVNAFSEAGFRISLGGGNGAEGRALVFAMVEEAGAAGLGLLKGEKGD